MNNVASFNKTHKGLFYGFVPVYLDMTTPDCPGVTGRNVLCEWLLDSGHAIFSFACTCMYLIDPDFEPMFWIKITGEYNE
jgi:hypothetical protein